MSFCANICDQLEAILPSGPLNIGSDNKSQGSRANQAIESTQLQPLTWHDQPNASITTLQQRVINSLSV